ncbi:Zn-ribbon domain-containing OB-fold protein [Syntrophomonas wolfei]|jgi:hypothetical protein|uniref:Zn-ribbon domain-containing OB-fold protein n=1 Tax=Syntrophomonas wolfei TaxID=863 RepID=UPI00077499D0|nr:Zn-ribbon domain-containing OB-fold protein [Syntrophomonas wolfei]
MEYREFYQKKLDEGELYLQFCPDCQDYIFYPRSLCPKCLKSDWEWRKLSGKAVLYSYTVVHYSALPEFKEDTPYVLALVELAEGPRMLAHLPGLPFDELQVGLALQLSSINREGRRIPAFQVVPN